MAVTLTETAADRVKTFLAAKENAVALRVGVKANGCSGYAYIVELVGKIGEDDAVYESHGVKIVVDGSSLPLLDGTEIHYTREGLNETFAYRNPNVRHQCGCGESFGV